MRSVALEVLSGLALVYCCVVNAQEQTSSIKNSEAQPPLIAPLEHSKANAWNLKPEEWRRFQQLMEGPLGVYSPEIDPLTALGIEARDEEERKRYTEMQAHAEYNRVTKLFAYQNAYDEAFARLYPNLLTVDLLSAPSAPKSSPMSLPNRLAVFVSMDCKGCIERVHRLQSADLSFDVYVLGTRGSDEMIRDWASKAGIDVQRVHNRDITLNHDAGRWHSVGDKGGFPAVMQQVNGQWQRQ